MPPESSGERNLAGNDMDRAIDRFWDHVAQGLAEDAGGVDPADAATIRHLHRFDDRPDPTDPFARQLREDLMATHAIPISSPPRPMLGPAGAPPNGRAHNFQPRAPAALSPRRARAIAKASSVQVIADANRPPLVRDAVHIIRIVGRALHEF